MIKSNLLITRNNPKFLVFVLLLVVLVCFFVVYYFVLETGSDKDELKVMNSAEKIAILEELISSSNVSVSPKEKENILNQLGKTNSVAGGSLNASVSEKLRVLESLSSKNNVKK